MPNQFSASQARTSKYWYEKIPYTYYTPAVPLGRPTTVFSVADIAATTSRTKFSILSDLAVSQVPMLSLSVGHADQVIETATTAYPSNLTPTHHGENKGIRSTKRLSLELVNSTGAPVDNVQVNYAVAMKHLTTADKVLFGIPLANKDQAWQQKFNIHTQGVRPLAISTLLSRAFQGQIIDETEYTYSLNVGTFPMTLATLHANAGEALVMTGIASNATLGNQVSISVSRDDDQDYVQVLADNMSNDTPLFMWLPAAHTLSIATSAVTAESNVPIRFTVLRVKLSTVLRVMFGLVQADELSGEDMNIYQSVMAGVLV